MHLIDFILDSRVDSFFTTAAIIFGIFILIALIITIMKIVGKFLVFRKAGRGGWEVFIPFYSSVVNCQITGVNPWWVLIALVVGFIGPLIPIIGGLLSFAVAVYYNILLAFSTAKSFGKDDGFAIGLLILEPIFWIILGFSRSEYVGPTPMNDFVMNFFNNNKTSSLEGKEKSKICESCGFKTTDDSRFCPNCGKEMK